MATKKTSDEENTSETESASALAGGDAAVSATRQQEEAMAGQIADLRSQVASLMLAVQVSRQQDAHTSATQNAIADIKSDLNLTKALLANPPAVAYGAVASAPARYENAKDCGCECTAPGCCCFEIRLAKIRAAKPQIEPHDAGDVPLLINALEVQFYITVGGIGFLFPGIGSTMDLRASGLPGGPGPWVVIERMINRVCLPRGTTMTYDVEVEVREHDEGAVERPVAFKDELGEGRGSITLDCCMANIYPPTPIDVPLIHGGEGGGLVQFAFYARRVCC